MSVEMLHWDTESYRKMLRSEKTLQSAECVVIQSSGHRYHLNTPLTPHLSVPSSMGTQRTPGNPHPHGSRVTQFAPETLDHRVLTLPILSREQVSDRCRFRSIGELNIGIGQGARRMHNVTT